MSLWNTMTQPIKPLVIKHIESILLSLNFVQKDDTIINITMTDYSDSSLSPSYRPRYREGYQS